MTAAEALIRFISDTNLLSPEIPKDEEQYEYNYIVACALDKQIPRKIIKSDAFSHRGVCRFCNTYVKDRYCPHCGQKIDWGDIK